MEQVFGPYGKGGKIHAVITTYYMTLLLCVLCHLIEFWHDTKGGMQGSSRAVHTVVVSGSRGIQ